MPPVSSLSATANPVAASMRSARSVRLSAGCRQLSFVGHLIDSRCAARQLRVDRPRDQSACLSLIAKARPDAMRPERASVRSAVRTAVACQCVVASGPVRVLYVQTLLFLYAESIFSNDQLSPHTLYAKARLSVSSELRAALERATRSDPRSPRATGTAVRHTDNTT